MCEDETKTKSTRRHGEMDWGKVVVSLSRRDGWSMVVFSLSQRDGWSMVSPSRRDRRMACSLAITVRRTVDERVLANMAVREVMWWHVGWIATTGDFIHKVCMCPSCPEFFEDMI